MLELISVHVPKCAGTSMISTLRRAYGDDAVLLDYEDRPLDPHSPMHRDPAGTQRSWSRRPLPNGPVRVVHGHFHLAKYRGVPRGCPRITFLRHPIDRTLSHYYFWRRSPRHGHPLHDYVLDNDLSIIDFARLPFIAGFYREVFFGGVERDELDFVGDVDRLDEGFADLSDLLKRDFQSFTLNVATDARRADDDDPSARRDLARLLADEIDFYRSWVAH